jgi:hypothetical protein
MVLFFKLTFNKDLVKSPVILIKKKKTQMILRIKKGSKFIHKRQFWNNDIISSDLKILEYMKIISKLNNKIYPKIY